MSRRNGDEEEQAAGDEREVSVTDRAEEQEDEENMDPYERRFRGLGDDVQGEIQSLLRMIGIEPEEPDEPPRTFENVPEVVVSTNTTQESINLDTEDSGFMGYANILRDPTIVPERGTIVIWFDFPDLKENSQPSCMSAAELRKNFEVVPPPCLSPPSLPPLSLPPTSWSPPSSPLPSLPTPSSPPPSSPLPPRRRQPRRVNVAMRSILRMHNEENNEVNNVENIVANEAPRASLLNLQRLLSDEDDCDFEPINKE